MVGGAGSSVVIGDIAASTAAQTGATQVVTVDANGTLGTSQVATLAEVANVRVAMAQVAAVSDAQFISLQDRVGMAEGSVSSLFDLQSADREDARRGIAAAMAQAEPPFPSAPGRTAYAGRGAVYRGEYAFSLGIAHRLDTPSPFALSASLSHAGAGHTGASVGFAGEF